MEQKKTSKKGKHLTREERIVIERMSRGGYPARDIADVLDRHVRAIEREMKRGQVMHKDSELREKEVYSSDRGQEIYDRNARAKGPACKIDHYPEATLFIRDKILRDRFSPSVIAHLMKELNMLGAVCQKTIYTYVEKGLIPGVSSSDLWEKPYRRKQGNKATKRHKKLYVERTSIEKRPEDVYERMEFGHWEIDLIVGGKGCSKRVLMTLIERKTRRVIIRKLKDATQASVLKALRAIEAQMGSGRFRALFQSITADNGPEFLDIEGMEQSAFSKLMRLKMYYAHPYSSWERGSNENVNRMIRRFISKGSDIGAYTSKFIQQVQDWINNYPRKVIEFQTAKAYFEMEAAA